MIRTPDEMQRLARRFPRVSFNEAAGRARCLAVGLLWFHPGEFTPRADEWMYEIKRRDRNYVTHG